jgi:hypothetical protein
VDADIPLLVAQGEASVGHEHPAFVAARKSQGRADGAKAAVLSVQCHLGPIFLRSLIRFLPAQYMTPAHRRTHPSFPKVRPHAPNTIQTPGRERLTWIGKIKQSLWTIGKRLTENDTKYAVKAGMATALLAAPAFFDATRPMFVELWGDWALISVRFLAVVHRRL